MWFIPLFSSSPWQLSALRLNWHRDPLRTLMLLSKAKSPVAWQSKAIIWIIAEKQGDRKKCQLEISCITCRAGESTIDLHSVLRRWIPMQLGCQGIGVVDVVLIAYLDTNDNRFFQSLSDPLPAFNENFPLRLFYQQSQIQFVPLSSWWDAEMAVQ